MTGEIEAMIAYLNGKIAEKQPTRIVLDVNGVGYDISIPLSSYNRLPAKGNECRILTYHHLREDCEQLIGFMTEEEREMFCLLLSVSGIGPKLALSVLSGLSAREIKVAVAKGDDKRLSSISGIGKKTAERIVVELKHKLEVDEILEASSGSTELSADDAKLRDAVLALIALGYKQFEAGKMVGDVVRSGDKNMSIEEIVKKALNRA